MDALFDLGPVLRSKKEQLTLQEANILLAVRARARRDFYVGAGGGSIVTYLATQRLHNLFRISLTLGAGVACGLWQTVRSLDSSVEHILSLEGSRIQRELANLMLKKHHDDPMVQQRLSNYFYSEKVYDDSSADRPILRWRYRNFFGDPVTTPQNMENTPHSEETTSKENNVKKTTGEPKQAYASAAGDDMESPFDFIFGIPGSAEDVPQAGTPTTSSRRQMRREKRSRRRRRRYHHEESDI